MNINYVKFYKEYINKSGYSYIINIIENILLRPNYILLLIGEYKLKVLVETVKQTLEEKYKDKCIYKYTKEQDGFCGFERWKKHKGLE